MDQGRITLHVRKDTLKCGAMPKDQHQLANTHKIRIKEQHEDEVTAKSGKHQKYVALGSKRKRGGGNQQKMNWTLSRQDECFSTMAQCFMHSPSFLSIRMLRDDYCVNAMKTVAGANEFSTLTIPNFKIYVNAEHNALM